MEVLESIESLHSLRGPLFLGIGVFDGVHLGHQAVLRRTQEEAARSNGSALPLSFDPHPASVLRPEAAPPQLTNREHKLRLLASLGFSHALLLRFDATIAQTPAEHFIEALAEAARPLGGICVGEDWTFGRGRSGNLELLQRLGQERHFEAFGVEPILFEGEILSSTRIRAAVAEGCLELAAAMLGGPYSVLGEVQRGRQLASTLGFPTANLTLANEQLPPFGVYAVTVLHGSRRWHGVANLGVRPTLNLEKRSPLLEVHLLDTEGDLYGQTLEVQFHQFLRPEQRFETFDALREQIVRDVALTRDWLSAAAPGSFGS